MSITVLFFSFARERMNRDRWSLQVQPGTDLRTLYAQHLEAGLKAPVGQWMFSVNETWAALETVLHDGDEVAVIPPVSGG